MPQNTPQLKLAAEWEQLCDHYSPTIHELVHASVSAHRQALATGFYGEMMNDPAASFFLSDSLVKTRLHAAMENWLVSVFNVALRKNYLEAVNHQKSIGEVHARIGIPAYLVMRGARGLDRRIYDLLGESKPDEQVQAVAYVAEVTSLSIEIMCHSYAISHERNARAEESYRLFAMSQNIGAEKERQRAALLDWENQLMFELTVGDKATGLPLITKSEFGLWFLHKASHAFEGTQEVKVIATTMGDIDQQIRQSGDTGDGVPATSDPAERVSMLRQIRDQTKAIGFLLDRIFEQAGHLESGRDVLTQLLNRKYLQVIMSREIDYARKHDIQLAVLAIDIDHFKQVNDTYGHEGGDIVLQQLALLITHSLRGGDYIFRLGGEEFLVVLIDIDAKRAMAIAEILRRRAETEKIVLTDKRVIQVSLSIGVAMHTGHPDYLRLLKAADEALYKAKALGRNQVVSSPSQQPPP